MLTSKTVLSGGIPVFRPGVETATGGFKLDQTGFAQGDVIPAGSMLKYDESTRIAKVLKTAKVVEIVAADGTSVKVAKGSNFKAGEFIGVLGDVAVAVDAVDTANANYDTITLDATLGALAVGAVLTQAVAAAADNAAAFVIPNGLLKEDLMVSTHNSVDAVVKGTVYANRIPVYPAALEAEMPFMLFSKSK